MQEFLAQRGVTYVERDVAADPLAMEELTGMGFYSTPVTVIDGVPVVGFDRKRLEELLG